MGVELFIQPLCCEAALPALPCVLVSHIRINRHIGKPGIHLCHYIRVELWLVLLNRWPEPLLVFVPEHPLDGGIQSLCFFLSSSSFLDLSETLLRPCDGDQRRIDLNVVHQESDVILPGDVIDAEAAVPKSFEPLFCPLDACLPFDRQSRIRSIGV